MSKILTSDEVGGIAQSDIINMYPKPSWPNQRNASNTNDREATP